MYCYQLLLAKDWQLLQETYQRSPQPGLSVVTQAKRIKHFYDTGYDDIVKLLVTEPERCKDFYSVLQQVGLPDQSYYEKIPNKVADVLKTALFTETAILIELPSLGGNDRQYPNYSPLASPL